MNLEKIYHYSDGHDCNILQLVKVEPEWAANIVQFYEQQLSAKGGREMTCDKHDIEIHGLPGEKKFCCTCECEKNLRNKITAKDARLAEAEAIIHNFVQAEDDGLLSIYQQVIEHAREWLLKAGK